MKQSNDGEEALMPSQYLSLKAPERPQGPHLLSWGDPAGGFPPLPVYWPLDRTQRRLIELQSEFCPHLDLWTWMRRAESNQPPCHFRMAHDAENGCPSGVTRECSIYVMHRFLGRSKEQARNKQAPPFDVDPKGRTPFPDGPPAWKADKKLLGLE